MVALDFPEGVRDGSVVTVGKKNGQNPDLLHGILVDFLLK